MLVFASFSLLSSLWAVNPTYAIEKGVTLFELLMAFWLLYSIHYHTSTERLLKIIMWAGFSLGIYTLCFYGIDGLAKTIENDGRLGNTFANINTIGMACSTAILICVYFFRRHRNIISLFFCIPALLIVAGSGSRKALVMLALGLFAIFFLQYRTDRRRNSNKLLKILGSVILFILLFAIVAQTGMFDGTMQRMEGMIASFTGEGEIDSSSLTRALYRDLGFAQLFNTPLVGIGMGNARILAMYTTGHDCYLHCNYAELAANGGIIGLALYYWIYVYIIKKEYSVLKKDEFALIIMIMVALQLVMDYGAVSYYEKSTYFFLMVVLLHVNKLKRAQALKL